MPQAETLPGKDARATAIRTTDSPCALATYGSLIQWRTRAAQLRKVILASAGLLPTPPKCPLEARVFGRIVREGYTIEKAYFQSYPGFLVTGNLYRPRGKEGPFPGVLCPHGHWQYGRFQDSPEASIPGRCINLARQGYVVFSYDMVGYNDSSQIAHEQLGGPREQLWGISLMGLQLWNSIRALDFLCSLPYVDSKRIGCTGASGGGTQTFLLTAVDDRVKAAAPVCMISAHFQGGCVCENGPNLRLDANNVEIGAIAAPRPLLLVSASGDWTKNTPKIEYPWIRDIYRLYGREDHVANVHFETGHNYNRESREAVYQWFARWLLRSRDAGAVKEQPFRVEPVRDLLVFYGEKYPVKRLGAAGLAQYLVGQSRAQLEAFWPKDKAGLLQFRKQFEVVFRCALGTDVPAPKEIIAVETQTSRGPGFGARQIAIGRTGKGDRVPAALLIPDNSDGARAALLVHGKGRAQIVGSDGASPGPLAARLLKNGAIVLAIDCFGIGDAAHEPIAAGDSKFTTYNRTEAAERVQDILTAIAYLRSRAGVQRVDLVGLGEAGAWCLLARGLDAGVNSCAVDLQKFDKEDDEAFAKRLYIPLLRRAGDLRTAIALAAPRRLFIGNAGSAFDTRRVSRLYAALGAPRDFGSQHGPLSDASIVRFLFEETAVSSTPASRGGALRFSCESSGRPRGQSGRVEGRL